MTQRQDYDYLLKFLTKHNRKRYANKWIAIKNNRVLIKSSSVLDVKEFLSLKKVEDALLYKIPKQQRKFLAFC